MSSSGGPLPALPQLPPPPPPPGGTGAPPGGQESPLGEAPAPHVPSVPGGRLAPLTRAFQAKRRAQQRQVARAPQVRITQRAAPESAEAKEERRQQIETMRALRALLQQHAGEVAKQNLPVPPPTPPSAQPDKQQAAAEEVKEGVKGGMAAKGARPTSAQGAAVIRKQAAALAAKRAAPKTIPLQQSTYTDLGGREMLADDEDMAGKVAPKMNPANRMPPAFKNIKRTDLGESAP